MADDLDETLTGVDLDAEDRAEVAGLGTEDFLNDGRVAQRCKDIGDAAACPSEFRRDAGDKDGRLVHGQQAPALEANAQIYREFALNSTQPKSESEAEFLQKRILPQAAPLPFLFLLPRQQSGFLP